MTRRKLLLKSRGLSTLLKWPHRCLRTRIGIAKMRRLRRTKRSQALVLKQKLVPERVDGRSSGGAGEMSELKGLDRAELVGQLDALIAGFEKRGRGPDRWESFCLV